MNSGTLMIAKMTAIKIGREEEPPQEEEDAYYFQIYCIIVRLVSFIHSLKLDSHASSNGPYLHSLDSS